ncbi:hypothetical protein MPSEU_000738200 [Mayamaea pseudoterrestris]|nr:hypothetical protein MPSEU_000738200 [Mayamaea pseudoterrestris]
MVVNVSALVPLRCDFGSDEHSALRSHDSKETIAAATFGLRAAYALDQDDNLIGYLEIAGNEMEGVGSTPVNRKLLITLLPGYTESIRIKALYADDTHTKLVSTEITPLSRFNK